MTDPVSYGVFLIFRPPIILNGTVDPHGLPTTVYFQWGLERGVYGNTTAPVTRSGNNYGSVSADIGSLTADGAPEDVCGPGRPCTVTYHFRVVATNSNGTRGGRDMTFQVALP